ncbi:hypothetical protein FQR65_LT03330 [Abscondita terminalis]|nr:hypothetical protein FQR65_LT03330 [Abscondita terminalis]
MNVIVILGLSFLTSQISGNKVVPMFIRQSWFKTTYPHLSECACQSKIDPILCTKVFLETAFSSDTHLQCYLKCLAEKLNFLDERTGKWSEKEIARQMEGVTIDIAKHCINLIKKIIDPSRNAFEMFLCMTHSLMTDAEMSRSSDKSNDDHYWIDSVVKQYHYEDSQPLIKQNMDTPKSNKEKNDDDQRWVESVLKQHDDESHNKFSHSAIKLDPTSQHSRRDKGEDERRWIDSILKQHKYDDDAERLRCSCK